VPCFLPVPVDGRKLSGHDETVLTVLNPDKRTSVWCHDEIVQIASKKQGTSASACNPIDSFSAAGTVRVAQNLISGLNSSLIDL